MNPDRLFDLAAEFAHATGNAERFHARAAVATGDDRAAHEKAASRWEAIAARRREHLRASLREALRGTVKAVPDERLPVATWQPGRVEVRATTLDGTRSVRVRYTPAQAAAAAVALIACAAITDDPNGSTLASILPAFPPNPPGDEPVTTDEGRPA
ncbi:hypothetical protein GCM10029963_72900 [Micromonospora andamanensis]|uniref:hypothetical protein n=1 Tax=Micromonospora andamanensis TaxID=1287068 RepID=UPI0019529E47|nr:hypothetical protein [Micromonospora andamanensis]GIJ39727.1 hypothetical protein Vwe01_30520 [Micromonospora andamanensis]